MLMSIIDNSIYTKDIVSLNIEFQNEIFVIVNIFGEILFASEGIKKFLGLSNEEMVGKSAYAFTYKDENPEISEAHGKLITNIGIVTNIKFRVVHKSGELLYVESTSKSFIHKNSEDVLFVSLLKKIHCF